MVESEQVVELEEVVESDRVVEHEEVVVSDRVVEHEEVVVSDQVVEHEKVVVWGGTISAIPDKSTDATKGRPRYTKTKTAKTRC